MLVKSWCWSKAAAGKKAGAGKKQAGAGKKQAGAGKKLVLCWTNLHPPPVGLVHLILLVLTS